LKLKKYNNNQVLTIDAVLPNENPHSPPTFHYVLVASLYR
jgi:hypothetical protein